MKSDKGVSMKSQLGYECHSGVFTCAPELWVFDGLKSPVSEWLCQRVMYLSSRYWW